MSRLGWTVTIISVCVAGLICVLVFLPRDLSWSAKHSAESAEAALKKAEALQKTRQQELDHMLSEHAAFLAKRPEVRPVRTELQRRAKLLQEGRTHQAELTKLVKRDSSGDTSAVYLLITRVTAAARNATTGYDNFVRPLKEVVRYKKDEAKLAAQAATDVGGAKGIPSAQTIAAVRSAERTHPKLATALDNRLRRCRRLNAGVRRSYAQLQQARGVDPVACGKLAEVIHARCELLKKAEQELLTDIANIDHHIDRILIDMKATGNQRYHKYKTVRDQTATQTDWQEVPVPLYNKHTPNLGLAIYSKPEGALVANTVAAPPGYAYVGIERYGGWRSPGGASPDPAANTTTERMRQVWHFNERYAYMPKLFWGASYKPVTYRDYLRYKLAGTSRRPYYGSLNQYGTNGSWTQRHYASSTYLLMLAASRRRRYSSSYGGSYGTRRYGSRRYGSRYGRSSYGGWGK